MPSAAVRLAAAGLACALAATPADALRIRGELGYGYDGNRFREAAAADDAAYVPYRLRLDHRVVRASGWEAGLELEARGSHYDGGLGRGGESRLGADVLVARELAGGAWKAEARGFLDRVRTVYLSRSAGEEYTVLLQDGEEVSLRDRFGSRDLGVALALTAREIASVRWELSARLAARDYRRDYGDVPGVDRLDYRSGWVELRGTRYAGERLRLRLGYRGSRRAYADRPARGAGGEEREDVDRRYHYHRVRADARLDASPFRPGLEVTRTARVDPFQGYLDSTEWAVEPGVEWKPTRIVTVEAGYRIAVSDYPRAHVSYDPVRPLRHDVTRQLRLEVTYRLPGSELFVGFRRDDVDQESPTYTYDRTRAWAGYRFELRGSGR